MKIVLTLIPQRQWHLALAKPKGRFIYYVITFLGFLDPPPPLRQHVFSTKNKQKLAFSDPPSPPTSADVIYEWSHMQVP